MHEVLPGQDPRARIRSSAKSSLGMVVQMAVSEDAFGDIKLNPVLVGTPLKSNPFLLPKRVVIQRTFEQCIDRPLWAIRPLGYLNLPLIGS